MSIKPQYTTQTYFTQVERVTAQSAVECRFSAGDFTDVVAVYPHVSKSDCAPSSGRINYGGRLVCTVVYADESGKLCRVQKGVEFTHFVDGENFAPAQTAQCNLNCAKTSYRRDGSALVVTSVINAEIAVYDSRECKYLTAVEGGVCRRENVIFSNNVPFSGACEVEDEFDADGVSDVLIPTASPVVYGCDCSAGTVKINGEIALSMLAIRHNLPVCIERVVPFKAEIACDNASLGAAARADVCVSELAVTAQVNEDNGKCRLSCDCALSIEGMLCEQTQTQAVTDLFCADCGVNVKYCDLGVKTPTGYTNGSRRVQSVAVSSAKLDFACVFKAVALPTCEYNYLGGKLEGAVNATLIYEKEGEIRTSQLSMPFSVEADEGEHSVAVCGVSVRQQAEGECEMEAVLKICCLKVDNGRTRVICEVSEGDKIEENDSAVSVYIPSKGDGLWDVAKKLKKSPEEVESCNPDLKFPLTGGERIIVYRRKAI